MKKDKTTKLTLDTTPKDFRVWDGLHHRWFSGGTSQSQLEHHTDCVAFFGETLLLEGSGHDQNEDDAWKESLANGELKYSLERYNYLVVLQSTGIHDKTGRKIFEGDILEFSGILHGLFFVSYDKITGSYFLKDKNNHFCEIIPTWDSAIIVGNIFENGDLLTCDSLLKRLSKKISLGKKKKKTK